MDTFHRNPFYNRANIVVSAIVLPLQAASLILADWSMSFWLCGLLFIVAYLITDFVNGLVHMFMDNNNDYTSIVGPLIAIFHMHHKHPRYTDRHPALIYIFETGSKNWLVLYMCILVYAQSTSVLAPSVNLTLVMVGILSSFAEVSHYLCHNSTGTTVRWLQRRGILLHPAHHAAHHNMDNMNYAFLNGITDPLLNLIAKHICRGYVNYADLHVAAYDGPKIGNKA